MTTSQDYVLLIEDDIDISEALEDVFKMEDIHFHSEGNGLNALQYLEGAEHPPSLIIMDLMMPHFNGIDFRKIQLGNSKFANIPTIVMSATRDLEILDDYHFNETIKKPIDIDHLIYTIKKYLSH
jgi:DNA-binding NtrC family response regulator